MGNIGVYLVQKRPDHREIRLIRIRSTKGLAYQACLSFFLSFCTSIKKQRKGKKDTTQYNEKNTQNFYRVSLAVRQC